MTKVELRKKYKKLRQQLSKQQIDEWSLAIANQVLKLPIWDFAFYHVFLSIEEQNEVNTDYILNILSGKDKHIVVSKSDFETGLMQHFLLTDSTKIIKNSHQIPEPVDGIEILDDKIEIVFIPLLAFDKLGHRVGYGKGFYDRFLKKCNPGTLKIGLSFFEADAEISDFHEGDEKLNYCVTPSQIYKF